MDIHEALLHIVNSSYLMPCHINRGIRHGSFCSGVDELARPAIWGLQSGRNEIEMDLDIWVRSIYTILLLRYIFGFRLARCQELKLLYDRIMPSVTLAYRRGSPMVILSDSAHAASE